VVDGELFSINYHGHHHDVVLTALGSAPASDHVATVAAHLNAAHSDWLFA